MPDQKLTPQQERIVNYLEQGRTITNVVALTCLGVGSLTSRISELRKKGYDIETEWEVGVDGRQFRKFRFPRSE